MKWDSIANAYAEAPEDRGTILLPIAISVIESLQAKTLVDVGGGDGRFLVWLCEHFGSEYFRRLALIEPSPQMRTLAVQKLAAMPSVEIGAEIGSLERGSWDAALFIAVWMVLRTDQDCITVLREVRGLLRAHGRLVIAVTHPCFRDREFNSYRTSFDMKHYLASGKTFDVSLSQASKPVTLLDTHWTLGDHVRQLAEAGFRVEALHELKDVDPASAGSPWLVIVAAPA